MASALDEWVDANMYRLIAVQSYTNNYRRATQAKDETSMWAFDGLGKELDQLERFRLEILKYQDDEDGDELLEKEEGAAEAEEAGREGELENDKGRAAETFDFESPCEVAAADNTAGGSDWGQP